MKELTGLCLPNLTGSVVTTSDESTLGGGFTYRRSY